MHTQLSHSLVQQHVEDLRAEADRRRLAAQAAPARTAVPGSSQMRIARRFARLARRLAVVFPAWSRTAGAV